MILNTCINTIKRLMESTSFCLVGNHTDVSFKLFTFSMQIMFVHASITYRLLKLNLTSGNCMKTSRKVIENILMIFKQSRSFFASRDQDYLLQIRFDQSTENNRTSEGMTGNYNNNLDNKCCVSVLSD